MKKAELVSKLADQTGVSKAKVDEVLGALVSVIGEEVAAGGDVALTGLGSFSLSERPARRGRNPRTGEEIEIGPSRSLKFKPSKTIKDKLN
jgi:DNA-binding protein HU-beta